MLSATVAALIAMGGPVLAAPAAETLVKRAEKALGKKRFDQAIAQAEAAVAAAPKDAGIRMVLGRAYLESGRFRSAAASFADALALDPTRGNAALSLVLARLATGDVESARTVLATHGELIPAGDRGLALALAGDLATAVPLLEAAVREGGSDAKTRQNLALSYALAGRWPEAKLMASYDLDPATLSQRIMEWSRLARDAQASKQVATLLGVAHGPDAGMPTHLALSTPEPARAPAVQVAEASPPPPERMPEAAAAPIAPPAVAQPVPAVFAPVTPVVQTIMPPASHTPVKSVAAAAPATPRVAMLPRPSGGRYAVQIGAFDTLDVAQASWDRSARRIGMLRDYTPSTATVVSGGAVFHRLSVSGFATRAEAIRVCETLRARGGTCFVRTTAGDMPLQWVMRSGGGTRLAAR
jgi:Flp pilus assembly protein TadD